MADDKIRYVLDVDDKGTPKLVKFGATAEKSSKQASKGFSGASKALGDFGQQIPGVNSAMSGLAMGGAAMAGAAVGGLAVGFASVVAKSIDMADSMNDLSLRLGVSTERLSVLSLYAEQSGTDIETLATGMGKLGVKLSSGDKQLAAYGITAGSVDEALFQLADRVAGTEDPMLRLKMATDAFGKSGQQMLPLLVQGGDALRAMAADAPIVSTELAQMADEFNDKMAGIKGQFKGIALEVTTDLLPALQDTVDLVGQIVNGIRGGKGNTLQGIAMEEAKIAKLRAESESAGISSLRRRQIESEIRNAQAGIVLRAQGQLESDIGKMSGPGGMGGYRGESLTVKPTGVIGAGATDKTDKTAKAGPTAKPGSADYFDAMGIDYANTQYRANQARQASFDAAKQASGDTGTGAANQTDFGGMSGMPPDWYAGIPLSDKAKESLEKQYKDDEERRAKIYERQAAAAAKGAELLTASGMAGFQVLDDTFARMQARNAEMEDSWTKTFQGIGLAFSSMLAKMVEEMAVKSAIFGAFSLFGGGGLLGGGATGGAGLLNFLGFASGGTPPVGSPSIVGERRAEMFVPRGPGRVEPTAPSGNTYNITVSNPAEAQSMLRGLQRDERRRNRGIR